MKLSLLLRTETSLNLALSATLALLIEAHLQGFPEQALASSAENQKTLNSAEPLESTQETPLDLSPRPNLPHPRTWQGALPSLGPTWNFILGLGSRGTIGESNEFESSLGFELGLGIPLLNGFDVGLAAGQFLEEGKATRIEGVVRYFLLWPQGGPYLGAGVGLRNTIEKLTAGDKESSQAQGRDVHGTLGLFGGEGLYCEFDFRKSAWRPVAMIFEFGLRFRPDIFQPTQSTAQGPLVKFTRSPSKFTFEH